MKNKTLFLACSLIFFISGCSKSCCTNKCNNGKTCVIKTDSISMEANNKKEVLACSLSTIEMKERIKTIGVFKSLITEKKVLENGVLLKFEGSNKNLEEILNLIKLERQCCSFLTFELSVQKESNPIHLTISGPEGTKDFLGHELGL